MKRLCLVMVVLLGCVSVASGQTPKRLKAPRILKRKIEVGGVFGQRNKRPSIGVRFKGKTIREVVFDGKLVRVQTSKKGWSCSAKRQKAFTIKRRGVELRGQYCFPNASDLNPEPRGHTAPDHWICDPVPTPAKMSLPEVRVGSVGGLPKLARKKFNRAVVHAVFEAPNQHKMLLTIRRLP